MLSNKKLKEIEERIELFVRIKSEIIQRDEKIIDRLQRRVDYLECLFNKIDTDSFYPKVIKETKETHRTLGTHEFEVSNRVTFEDIKTMLDLNFKSHYDIFMCGSEHSKTVMVKLIFDDTYYNDKAVKSLKVIKEYLKHSKRI